MLLPRLIGADEQRKILRHRARFDGLDDDVFESVGESRELSVVVEFRAVREPTGPRIDRRDRVRRSGFARLVVAVVPRDGSVRSLGLDGLCRRA